MTLSTVMHHLMSRILLIVVITLAALAAAVGWVLVREPAYASTATIGLVPAGTSQAPARLEGMGQVEVAAPLFTEAAESTAVRTAAASKLPDGVRLGTVAIRTFRETPIVFKIVATASSAVDAKETATAYAEALIDLTASGAVLPVGLVEARLVGQPALATSSDSPRTGLTIGAAGLVGLLLGCSIAVMSGAKEERDNATSTSGDRSESEVWTRRAA